MHTCIAARPLERVRLVVYVYVYTPVIAVKNACLCLILCVGIPSPLLSFVMRSLSSHPLSLVWCVMMFDHQVTHHFAEEMLPYHSLLEGSRLSLAFLVISKNGRHLVYLFRQRCITS